MTDNNDELDETRRRFSKELEGVYAGYVSEEQFLDDIVTYILSNYIAKSEVEEIIGEMESRSTNDMSLKSWTPEDYRAFGRNELRIEQRLKLRGGKQ